MQALLQDSGFYWLLWLIASLFGFLVGWTLRAAWREKAILEAYERSEQERNSLAHLYSQLRAQHDQKTAEAKKLTLEIAQLRHQTAAYELEKALSASTAQADAARLEKAQADAAHFAEKLQLLAEQAEYLRTRNTQLSNEVSHLQEELLGWKTLHRDFSVMLRQLQSLENNSTALQEERDQLQLQLDAARIEIENLQLALLRRSAGLAETPKSAADAAASDRHAFAVPTHPTELPANADDLKLINGITPFAEQQLHSLGIFTLAQISQWDDEVVNAVSAALGLPAAQIRQEDWVGQARHLLGASR